MILEKRKTKLKVKDEGIIEGRLGVIVFPALPRFTWKTVVQTQCA